MMDDPLLGQELGRYRIVRMIGEGGMGRVYLAIQPEIGARVAIKVLSSHDRELVERFFAEARAVNLIHDEHIVDVLDLARLPDGRPYIVMELVDGQTLRDVVRAGPAPLGAVTELMIEVLSALAATHAVGIVHRDLKPDNIAITAHGHAKVLDFGIAKLSPALQGERAPRTHSGVAIGTPEYMAPEQVKGHSVDARTDLYATGIVLFEAVTGRLPFAGSSDFELMRAHLETPAPSARALRPDLPEALDAVIAQAMAKRPEDRFQSAAAMANALRHALTTLPAQLRGAFPTPRRADDAVPTRRASPPTPAATVPAREPPTRQDPAVDGAPPAIDPSPSATVRERPSARKPPPERPAARRWPWLLGGAIAAAGTVVAVMMATERGTTDRVATASASPPAEASAVVPADAGAAVPADASGVVAAIVDAAPRLAPPDASAVAILTPGHPATRPRAVRPAPAGTGARPEDPSGGAAAGSAQAATGPQQVEHAPDYDPDHFDPLGYLPTAQRLARSLLDDAELSAFDFDAVRPDGRAVIRKEGGEGYTFLSVKHTGGHDDRPEPFCMVEVTVERTRIYARTISDRDCRGPHDHPRPPTCTLTGVWDNAARGGARRDLTAEIRWHAGTWNVAVVGPDRMRQFDAAIADRCGDAIVKTSRDGAPPEFARRPDFDAKRFDPLAYLPKAQELARALLPGATVTHLKFENVSADGRADLTRGRQLGFYTFGVGKAVDGFCEVFVTASVDDVRAGLVRKGHDACSPVPGPPRCTLAQMYRRVGATGDATFEWSARGWEYSVDEHLKDTLDDTCK